MSLANGVPALDDYRPDTRTRFPMPRRRGHRYLWGAAGGLVRNARIAFLAARSSAGPGDRRSRSGTARVRFCGQPRPAGPAVGPLVIQCSTRQ